MYSACRRVLDKILYYDNIKGPTRPTYLPIPQDKYCARIRREKKYKRLPTRFLPLVEKKLWMYFRRVHPSTFSLEFEKTCKIFFFFNSKTYRDVSKFNVLNRERIERYASDTIKYNGLWYLRWVGNVIPSL